MSIFLEPHVSDDLEILKVITDLNENNEAVSEKYFYNMNDYLCEEESYACVDPTLISGSYNLENSKVNDQQPSQDQMGTCEETSQAQQVDEGKRTWSEYVSDSVSVLSPNSPKRIKNEPDCKNDRLFEEAKRAYKKIVPFGSKLTIMGSREYFECIVEGRKISQKNQEIVDQAMANNQRVRSNYGRKLTIAGTKEYFDRKETNLENTHLCRGKQNNI